MKPVSEMTGVERCAYFNGMTKRQMCEAAKSKEATQEWTRLDWMAFALAVGYRLECPASEPTVDPMTAYEADSAVEMAEATSSGDRELRVPQVEYLLRQDGTVYPF